MNALRVPIGRYPLVAFFVITYAFAWTVWVPLVFWGQARGDTGVLWVAAGGFGPVLAATTVTWATEGSAGVRRWARNLLRWRVGIGWYAVALVGMLAVNYLAFGFYLLLGGSAPAGWQPQPWYNYLLTVVALTLVGGGHEEPGWRGFALPRLQARFGATGAALLLGVVWACWHLPLFVAPGDEHTRVPFLGFAAFMVAMSLILTWLYDNSRGSILPAMLLHAGANGVGGLVPLDQTALGTPAIALSILAAHWLAAIALVVIYGPARLRRSTLETVRRDAERPSLAA